MRGGAGRCRRHRAAPSDSSIEVAAMETALIGFAAMLFLVLVLRVPITFAMGIVGFVGFAQTSSYHAALALLGDIVADTPQNYSLSIVPLFILMGNFVSRAGLSHELYTASHAFLGHRRG